ncbi:conjugal transfer protein TraN, partial [Vibrio owensii]
MFKKAVTWVVMFAYTSNMLTAAFMGVLIGMMSFEDAYAAPQKPVQLQYTCPNGTTLIGGQCMKTEIRSVREYCDSGYYRDGSSNSCLRDESQDATPVCGSGYRYDERLFPEQCFVSISNDKLHESCPSGYTEKIGRTCYKLQPVQRWNCPADAPGAAPETTTLSCSEMASSMGECSGSSTFTTPDQRWKLDQPVRQCNRTLWRGSNRTCDTGFEVEGDSCKKVTLTKPTRSCPSGYFEKDNQCFPGTQPSCPAGSTMRYGVCHAPNGTLSCPKGKYLDTGSNLCVANRNDSQPTEWTSQDFNHFFEQGADLGGMLSSSVTMPSVSGVGSMNMNPSFLNAEVTTQDANLYNEIAGGGVDANNGFTNPDGTYQNEENQTEFVQKQLDSNKSFLDNQENVPGATSEEQVDNTNHSALAYGALMDSRNLNPPRKISRDSAMFQVSRETVGDAFNNRGAYFGDCSSDTTTYQELDPSKIVTNQQSCFKPNKNNLSGCIMERRPIPPTFAIIEGQDDARVQQCGEKCIQLTLGKTGDNYLPQYGRCGIYEKKIVIGLKDGFHVDRATLTRTHYDDHFRLYADGQIIFDGVHANYPTPDGFPTSSISCELSKSRDTYDPRDVTPQFEAALQNDDRIEFTYKVAVGGDGEAYGKVEIIFDKPISSLWGEELIELPKGCAEKLERPAQTHCTASGWECTREFTSEDENFGLVNISKGDKGDGYGLPGSHGDVLILVARRDFDIRGGRGQNCGLVVATTWNSHDGNDDDGIYFCEDYAGVGTHTQTNRQIRGTRLSNLMPRKGEWEIIAVRTDAWGSTWYRIDENGEFQKFNNQNLGGGPYDGLRMSGYRIARATSRNGLDWHNRATEPLYFAYWQMLSKPSDDQVKGALKEIYLEQPWLNYSPLFPGDNGIPICMEAFAKDYVCDPLQGRRMSLNGGSFGFKDIIKMDDACSPLDKNDQCDAISQECVPGWEDPATNTCYAWNVKYECQDTSNAVVTKTRKNDTCFTDDSCIDGTCDVRADETNTDFTNALTTYATMNELGDTKNCTTPNDPNSCRVFSGEPRWCGWDQLKVNDCCEQPSGVNVLDVFRLGQQMYTVTGYMASADGAFGGSAIQTGLEAAGSAVEGVWNSLTDPIADAASSTWNTVSSKLTGAVGNTAGNTSANLMSSSGSVLGNFKTSVMDALSNFKDTLMQKIYDLLPEALQNAIQSAAQSLGASAGASGATAMNTV